MAFSRDWLASWRHSGDPAADAAIEALCRDDAIGALNALYRRLGAAAVPREALPAEALRYFDCSDDLPGWADPAKIAHASRVFMRHGVLGLASLLCAALPECYALADGARVLGLTQALTLHTRRRLYETAQMVVEVLAPGGLAPGGRGVRVVQKVRLLHAAMRRLVSLDPALAPQGPPDRLTTLLAQQAWDAARWGLPINQEDLAFTLIAFDHVIRRSWARLGLSLSTDDLDAYHHAWRVTGSLLGIDEALLPDTRAESEALYHAIVAHQAAPSAPGVALTRALQGTLADTLRVPVLRTAVPQVLMHRLLDPGTRAILQIAPPPRLVGALGGCALSLADFYLDRRDEARQSVPTLAHLGTYVGLRWVRRLTRLEGSARASLFELPPVLREAWGVEQGRR